MMVFTMKRNIQWDSQPLEEWRTKYAKGKFVDLDGYATHYLERGKGKPVILLHGWFHDSQMWAKNIDALAECFKVYALDLWGFGYSTRAPLDHGYPLYSRQLLKFMDALNISSACLIGQSMGAGTSILFSTQYKDRVNKLVLVTSGGLPNPPQMMSRIVSLPCVGEFMFKLGGSRRGILRSVFVYDERSIAGEYFEDIIRFHYIKGTNKALLSCLRNNFFDKLLNEIQMLGVMRIPALIVWGRHDHTIPVELGQRLHETLKGSNLQILEESAHCPNYEEPEKFNAIVNKFLLD